MSLADYIAKNYLTADPSTTQKQSSKKRKRKDTHPPTATTISDGLQLLDDDDNSILRVQNGNTADSDDDRPSVANSRSTKSKFKKSSWVAIGAPAPSNSEQTAADAILADAARDVSERGEMPQEEAPMVVDTGADADGNVDMTSRDKKKKSRRERDEGEQQQQETVYRDATGRRVNVAMARAAARQRVDEEESKKREQVEMQIGDVQKEDKERRKQELSDAKFWDFARGKDDEDINREMKEAVRWNDPMAGMLSEKKDQGGAGGAGDGKVGGRPRKKVYTDGFEPNRYGIRPGFLWDGVERGSGFERQWFAARNKQKDRQEMEYAWQMDE